jgi:hypothetical protein
MQTSNQFHNVHMRRGSVGTCTYRYMYMDCTVPSAPSCMRHDHRHLTIPSTYTPRSWLQRHIELAMPAYNTATYICNSVVCVCILADLLRGNVSPVKQPPLRGATTALHTPSFALRITNPGQQTESPAYHPGEVGFTSQ